MSSRYGRIVASGGAYVVLRIISTAGLWLTPMPRMKRPGNASSIVRHAAFAVIASRA